MRHELLVRFFRLLGLCNSFCSGFGPLKRRRNDGFLNHMSVYDSTTSNMILLCHPLERIPSITADNVVGPNHAVRRAPAYPPHVHHTENETANGTTGGLLEFSPFLHGTQSGVFCPENADVSIERHKKRIKEDEVVRWGCKQFLTRFRAM